jgi:hypothetical protein
MASNVDLTHDLWELLHTITHRACVGRAVAPPKTASAQASVFEAILKNVRQNSFFCFSGIDERC